MQRSFQTKSLGTSFLYCLWSYHTALSSTVVHGVAIIDAVYCDCEAGAQYLAKRIQRRMPVGNILRRVFGLGKRSFTKERTGNPPLCSRDALRLPCA